MQTNSTNTFVESPRESTGPQQASVNKLDIITSSGELVDVKKLLMELSYFEDMYSFAVSGYVLLRDAIGLVEKLQLTGKEYIRINFGRSVDSPSNIEKTFWLYTIPEKVPTGSLNQEAIKLHFTSTEVLLSETTKITNSYKGEKIDNIIENICSDKLKISSRDFNIEPTIGLYPFNVTAKKPFEAISWLSLYAKPSNGIGADMLFFENSKGFHFKSIQSMYQQEPVKTYSYQIKNVNVADLNQQLDTVLEYKFTKTFNSLEEANSGTFSNRVITFNPLNKTIKVNDFNYDEYRAQLNQSGGSAMTTSTNRLGFKQNETPVGKLRLFVSSSEMKKRSYVADGVDTIPEDIFIEECIKYRTAQLSLISRIKAKIRIPGDPTVYVGQTINFNLPSLATVNGQKEQDKYYSGKYLVTAVRHIIQSQGAFQTILEISREGPEKDFSDENSNSREILEARDE